MRSLEERSGEWMCWRSTLVHLSSCVPAAQATMRLMMSRDHRLVRFFLAVVIVVEYGCSSSPSAPTTTGPFVVSGLVLDFQTSAVVPTATVSFG
jgi:hypothetical protein